MRITGGTYKGRKIICPQGVIRPAMDRMRESLFAILGDLSGRSFLDMFSGSGIIGIEACSRGAAPVLLVEKDPGKIKTIRQNISITGSIIKLYVMPSERFIKMNKDTYDYIFLDPPFNFKNKYELIQNIAEKNMLNTEGFLLLHMPRQENITTDDLPFQLLKTKIYGGSALLFFKNRS